MTSSPTFENSPTVSRLTPPGRGAVGTILLRGENALNIFERRFQSPNGKKLSAFFENQRENSLDRRNARPVFGRFQLDATTFEEVVVYIESKNCVEIHCHGGDSVCRAIVARLEQAGAVAVSAFSSRPEFSSTAEEAFFLLPFAKTEKAAQVLLDQYSGVLDREIAETLATLEKANQERSDSILKSLKSFSRKIERSLSLAAWGERLTSSFSIVLIGPTNAGKSSLTNALTGFERTIVDSSAGTTRDAVSVETVLDGWSFLLTDTAGLRQTDQTLEKIGIAKTLEQISSADLILLVFDITTQEESPIRSFERFLLEKRISDRLDPARTLLILNKTDLPEERWNPAFQNLIAKREKIGELSQNLSTTDSPILTSVDSQASLTRLQQEIVRRFVPQDYRLGEAVPTSRRSREILLALKNRIDVALSNGDDFNET